MKRDSKIRLMIIVVFIWGMIIGFSRDIYTIVPSSIIIIGMMIYQILRDESEPSETKK